MDADSASCNNVRGVPQKVRWQEKNKVQGRLGQATTHGHRDRRNNIQSKDEVNKNLDNPGY